MMKHIDHENEGDGHETTSPNLFPKKYMEATHDNIQANFRA